MRLTDSRSTHAFRARATGCVLRHGRKRPEGRCRVLQSRHAGRSLRPGRDHTRACARWTFLRNIDDLESVLDLPAGRASIGRRRLDGQRNRPESRFIRLLTPHRPTKLLVEPAACKSLKIHEVASRALASLPITERGICGNRAENRAAAEATRATSLRFSRGEQAKKIPTDKSWDFE